MYTEKISESNGIKGIAAYMDNALISFTAANDISSLSLRLKIMKGKIGTKIKSG